MTLGSQGLARLRAAGVPRHLPLVVKSGRTGLKLFESMKRVSALLAALLAASAAAQTAEPQQRMSETVSVGYVMIPFTALDPNGRPIVDLRAPEVALQVDGAAVKSDIFEKSQNAPVSFTILLDG